jgi:hypothetical protein
MCKKTVYIIAAAMIISSFILGSYFYNARKSVNTIRVVGHAAGEYNSDVLKWRLTFSASTNQNNQAQGLQMLSRDMTRFRDFLERKNFNTGDIEIMQAFNWPTYNRDGGISGHFFQQSVAFTLRDTSRFAEIEAIVYDMSELIATGITIMNSSIEYYISRLPEVKLEIIAEATKDARERALTVASTTNTRLGKLLNGRVGIFQITEPFSVEVQSMGIHSTHTRRKQISVTMTGVFELK